MKLKLFLVLQIFLFLNCKQEKTDIGANKSVLQVNDTVTAKNLIIPSDSIPFWEEAKLGSNIVLNSFPNNWSYPSITSDDYDESSKNKFNVLLEKIGASYNLIKTDLSSIKIPNQEIIIKDAAIDVLNYTINLKASDLTQLYKLNDKFSIAIFQQKENKPINNISKRIDLVVFDIQSNVIDKTNILFEGNGDQHAFMKYFYIDKGIIHTRSFYVYDGESSASSITKHRITKDGKIIIE